MGRKSEESKYILFENKRIQKAFPHSWRKAESKGTARFLGYGAFLYGPEVGRFFFRFFKTQPPARRPASTSPTAAIPP